MATNNSSNQEYSNESDGFKIGGGATKRRLTVTGGDVTVTGGGANTYTMPASGGTLATTGDVTTASTADRARANHTGSQAQSTVTNLTTDLAAKAATTYVDAADALRSPLLMPTAVKTANYSAAANDFVVTDATSASIIVTLPTTPAAGTNVAVKRNDATGNTVTVNCGGSDVFNKSGGSATQTIPFSNYAVTFQYLSGIWYQIANAMPIGQLDARYVTPTQAVVLSSKTMDLEDNTITGIPWCPEMVMNSALVADGYNDMPGGISVEPGPNANGCTLDSVWVRVGDMTNNGGGDLVVSIYNGTATTEGTLITTVTLTNGTNNQIGTLGTTYPLPANTVVRAKLTKGSSTLAKALHVQLRGRYVG